ncbi:MAG: hypothetical protein BMS9Abin07_0195 [Acidimicrobiia bacterium]|nr:MAG: hypothetical protein BMS9Abin07_0195 [Acidimicrobiia bacterium]
MSNERSSQAPTGDGSLTEADLETADAADAPEIAEALADRLEADLDDIGHSTGGEG